MTPDHSLYADKSHAYFEFPRMEIAPLLPDRIDRVLEIACGDGATCKWLRAHGTVRYAVGIDLMPDAAGRAESVFDVALSGNVETMEFPAGTFDLILALDVLEHLIDPWQVVRRLQTMLNPGGTMIVSIPNITHYSICIPMFLRGQWSYTDEGLLDRTHLRFFTRRTAVDLVTGSGLVMDKMMCVQRGPRFLSARARWYSLKLLSWALPDHLLDWQFLIRVKTA
jgi:SAM-dependent methyltransferase